MPRCHGDEGDPENNAGCGVSARPRPAAVSPRSSAAPDPLCNRPPPDTRAEPKADTGSARKRELRTLS